MPLARAWLVALTTAVLAFAETQQRQPRWMRALTFWLERAFAKWLVLSAYARVAPPPRAPQCARPRQAPQGFRIVRARGDAARRLVHMGGARASVPERLQRLLDIAADPTRLIARLTVKLERVISRGGLITWRLVAVAPPALWLTTDAPVLTRAAADSS